jgi:hypothetical protein
VKVATTLALLAVLGFAIAGCGATKKKIVVYDRVGPVNPIQVTGTGTTTIPNVKTGRPILCQGWKGPGVKVPPPGSSASDSESENSQAGTVPSSSKQIQLEHLPNGSLTVSCK